MICPVCDSKLYVNDSHPYEFDRNIRFRNYVCRKCGLALKTKEMIVLIYKESKYADSRR